MQYYLEDKDLYVDIDDSVPSHEAMRQIQDTIYTPNKVDSIGEVGNAFARSLIQSSGNLALAIGDIGDQLQNEPLKAVAANVGKGAHIKPKVNPLEFSLFGFGALGTEFYREGYKEYKDDNLQDFITSIGADISKRGSEMNDAIIAFSEQVAPYNEDVWRGDFMKNPSWTRAISTIASAIPSLATAIGVTTTTRNPMAAALVLGGFEGLQAKEEAKGEGATPQAAEAVKLGVGLGSALLENMSLGNYLENILSKGSMQVTKGIIKGTVIEGLEEASQQAWGNIVAKLGYDKTRNLTEGIIESLIAGAGSGGIMGGLTTSIPKLLNQEIENVKASGITQNDINVMTETIAADIIDNQSKVNNIIVEQMENANKIEFNETEEEIDLAGLADDEVADLAVNEILGKSPKVGTFEQYISNKEIKTAIKNASLNYSYRQLRPDRIFKMIDGFKSGLFTQKVWKPIANAAFVKKDLYSNFVKDIMEISKNIIQTKSFNNITTQVKGHNITEDVAMLVYAHTVNEDNHERLKLSGLNDAEIKKIVGSLSKEAKSNVDNIIKYFGTTIFPKLSKEYKRVKGKELPKIDKYFPMSGLEDAGSLESIDMELGQRFDPKFIRKEVGAVKERKGGEFAFTRFSFYDAVNKYLNDTSHYISHADVVQNASKLLSSRKVKQALREKYGNELVRINDKWLEDVSYGGFKPANSSWEKTFKWLRTNFVTSVLGYNLNTVAKQPISFLQGMNMIGEKAALSGLTRLISNPKEAIKFAESRSLYIKHRNFYQERTLNEIIQGKSGVEIFGDKNVLAMVRDGGMMPIQWFDKATVTSLWLGAYFDKTSQGVSESKAVDYANEVIEKTQPMGGVTFLPDDFRAGWMQQLYTTFRNQPSQNLNILFEITGEVVMKENATMNDYLKLGKGYAYMMIVGSFLMGLITRKKLPTVGEALEDAVSMPLRGAAVLGDYAMAGIQALNGNLFFAKRSLIPTGLGAIESGLNALGSKTEEAKMRNFTKFMFEITGTPYKPYKLFTNQFESSKKKAI